MSRWVLISYNTKDKKLKTSMYGKYEKAYENMGNMFQNIFIENEGCVKGGSLKPTKAFVKDYNDNEYKWNIYEIGG